MNVNDTLKQQSVNAFIRLAFTKARTVKSAVLLLMLFFIASLEQATAQTCSAEPDPTTLPGAHGTNFYNSGWYSSDPTTLEYDNFVSGFHGTAVRQPDGTFKIWGAQTGPSGDPTTGHLTAPTLINSTNFPGLVGTPLKVAKAGQDATVVLTSDGLYTWGDKGQIFATALFTGDTLQKLTSIVGANSYSLPGTITPSQVKMMTAGNGSLMLVTTTGSVYMLSILSPMYGDGGSGTTTWHQVKINATTTLDSIIAARVVYGGAIAIRADSTLWTWGNFTYLGNGTAVASRSFATQMTLPAGATGAIKMVSATRRNNGALTSPKGNTYYVLYTNGNLYALGLNSVRQIGDWTTTERLSWVQPRYTSAVGPVMNDIKWISANESGGSAANNMFANVNVITNGKMLYNWGDNDLNMIGGTTTSGGTNPQPGTANGLSATDSIVQVETGGHTTMVIKQCSNQFGYVGHYINGSIGAPGGGATTTLTTFNFTLTPSINVIGAAPINFTASSPTFNSACAICTGTPLTFVGDPTGGTFSITAGGTGSGTITSAGVLTATSPGTINVTYTGATTCPASLTKTYTFGNCPPPPAPPVANNITAPSLNNSQGPTAIPQLVASSPSGIPIESFTVTTLPPSTQGILYYCTSTTVPCPSGSLNLVTTSTVLTPAQAQSLYFDPAPGFVGNATFTYTAKDTNDAVSNTANYIIPIHNDPPVTTNILTAQMIDTNGSTPLPSLIAADKDGTIASYKVSSIPPASQGVLTYCSTGDEPCTGTVTTITGTTTLTPAQMATLKLDPTAGYTGNYTFNYTATDNNGNVSNVSSVTTPIVSAVGGNMPPVANNITAQNISNASGATAIPKLLGTDPDGTVVSYTIGATVPNPATEGLLTYCTTPPSTGCGTPVVAGQTMTPAQAATLSFDPVSSFVGNAVFTYTATDNAGVPLTSAPATYTIPVINTPPVANPDKVSPIVNTLTTPTLLPPLSGSDVEGPIATFNITSVPPATQGTLQYCATAPGTPCTPATLTTITGPLSGLTPDQVATLNFIPNSGFTGDYVFNFTTVDVNGAVSQPATFTIPVIAAATTVGEPPIANSYNATPISSTGTANLSSALSGTDPDGTISKYTITSIVPASEGVLTYCVTPPSTGCGTPLTVGLDLTPAQAATILFTPNVNFTGTSTFTYTATDNSGNLSNTGTVTIPVINQPPVAQNVNNTAISRSSGPTSLTPLVSTDVDGTVDSFYIHTIPTPDQGVLSVCVLAPSTGCTPVTPGQVLTPAQMAQLSFTPNPATTSPVVNFIYSTKDNTGLLSNLATVGIPMFDFLPLPLNFLNAQATVQDCSVLLRWNFNIEGESKLKQFEVERSSDARNYTRIAILNPDTQNYKDVTSVARVWYYRIKAVGFNNELVYTPTLVANTDNCASNVVKVYPNPANDYLNVVLQGSSVDNQYELIDALGRVVMKGSLKMNSSNKLGINNFIPGLYLLKIITDDNVQTEQVTIMR